MHYLCPHRWRDLVGAGSQHDDHRVAAGVEQQGGTALDQRATVQLHQGLRAAEAPTSTRREQQTGNRHGTRVIPSATLQWIAPSAALSG